MRPRPVSPRPRWRLLAAVATTAATATACGSTATPTPAGSSPPPPGFTAAAANPCSLVTAAEAEAILTHPLSPPQTGPAGTCVYLAPSPTTTPPRTTHSAHPKTPTPTGPTTAPTTEGAVTITLAEVPNTDIAEAVLPTAAAVTGLSHPAACGVTGTGGQMLFVLLDSHHLLEVVAPSCDTATAFATRALTHL